MINLDPEVASLLTEVDAHINNLMLNTNVDPSRLKDIQDKRVEIKNKIARFIEQNEEREKKFSGEIKSDIHSMQTLIGNAEQD